MRGRDWQEHFGIRGHGITLPTRRRQPWCSRTHLFDSQAKDCARVTLSELLIRQLSENFPPIPAVKFQIGRGLKGTRDALWRSGQMSGPEGLGRRLADPKRLSLLGRHHNLHRPLPPQQSFSLRLATAMKHREQRQVQKHDTQRQKGASLRLESSPAFDVGSHFSHNRNRYSTLMRYQVTLIFKTLRQDRMTDWWRSLSSR